MKFFTSEVDESCIPLLEDSDLPYDRVRRSNSVASVMGAAAIIGQWPNQVGRVLIILTTILAIVCLTGIVVWSQRRNLDRSQNLRLFQDGTERAQTSILIAVGPERKINADVLCSIEAAALAYPECKVEVLLLGSFPDADVRSVREFSSQYNNTQVKVIDPAAFFASSPLRRPPPVPLLELGARVLWLWSHGGWSPEPGIVPKAPGPQLPKTHKLVLAKDYLILGARHACQPQLYQLLLNLEGGGVPQGPGVISWTVCSGCQWVPRNISMSNYCPSVWVT